MPLLLIRQDITKVRADAIVNPSNTRLIEGRGTSKGIFEAAGERELTDACQKIGHCDMGMSVATEAFNLDAKYIIHCAGPSWQEGNPGQVELLYSTYIEAMKLAVFKECESVAFPLLSSGNYGFPKEIAVKTAISAISNFLMENELLVYLVLYDRTSLAVSQKLFTAIDEYIDDNYVDEKDEGYPQDYRDTGVLYSRNLCENDSFNNESEARQLDSLMENLEESFSQMLLRLIDERGLKDSFVYKKANIDRRHFSKIRNDIDYAPTKKTVVAFIIALELSMDEAVDLMNKAGFAFSNASKFDVIVSYFIENKQFNIFEINEVLFTYGQPILGE